jgi:adenylosuccinate lyase
MATETILMHAVRRGGDRQDLHERIRRHSVAAARREGAGRPQRPGGPHRRRRRLRHEPREIEGMLDPARFTGRAAEQVDIFLRNDVEPVLGGDVTRADDVPELRA